MAIRAQPVKSVFQRMPRLVREAAAATGKQVRLVTEGEATEVDKTVIERLTDPITHMMRNAVDHGLESPDDGVAPASRRRARCASRPLHRVGPHRHRGVRRRPRHQPQARARDRRRTRG